MTVRRIGARLGAVLVTSLMAAAVGCSSPAPPAASSAPPASAPAIAAPVPTVSQPASGGTLVFGGGQDTQSFNIILFPKSLCTCNSLIYSTLFKLNATGTDIEGDLVERWDIQPDGLAYTLHVRPNAVWHDGQPVTADDVVFTMQALHDPKTGSTYVAFLDGIDQFMADGPQTVRLTLKQRVPALLSRLSRVGVLPKHLLADEPNVSSTAFNQHPVGSGPFKFESYTPSVQLTMVRNDQYYLGPPHLDRVVYRFSPDLSVASLQLKTGEVQLAQLASANVPSLADAPDVVVDQFPTNGEGGIQLNFRNPLLSDVQVRQALSFAIDRPAFVQAVFAGLGQVEPAPIASTSPFYSPNFVQYAYDPARARELLAASGWQPGPDGIVQRNGVRFQIGINANSERPTSMLAAQVLQQQFKAVGVQVDINVYDFATWRDLNAKKQFDMYWTSFGSAFDPDDTEYSKYYSTSPANMAGLADADIDRYLDLGRHATDVTQRKQAYAQYQQRMTELLPMLFIGYDKVLLGANKRLQGISLRPVGYDGNAFVDNSYLWSLAP